MRRVYRQGRRRRRRSEASARQHMVLSRVRVVKRRSETRRSSASAKPCSRTRVKRLALSPTYVVPAYANHAGTTVAVADAAPARSRNVPIMPCRPPRKHCRHVAASYDACALIMPPCVMAAARHARCAVPRVRGVVRCRAPRRMFVVCCRHVASATSTRCCQYALLVATPMMEPIFGIFTTMALRYVEGHLATRICRAMPPRRQIEPRPRDDCCLRHHCCHIAFTRCCYRQSREIAIVGYADIFIGHA